jgi:hypothetical protein
MFKYLGLGLSVSEVIGQSIFIWNHFYVHSLSFLKEIHFVKRSAISWHVQVLPLA